MRTERQTDGLTDMTKLIADSRNFANAPNNYCCLLSRRRDTQPLKQKVEKSTGV